MRYLLASLLILAGIGFGYTGISRLLLAVWNHVWFIHAMWGSLFLAMACVSLYLGIDLASSRDEYPEEEFQEEVGCG